MEHPREYIEYPISPRLRAGAAWHTTFFLKDFLADALAPATVYAAALAMLLARYYGNRGPAKHTRSSATDLSRLGPCLFQ